MKKAILVVMACLALQACGAKWFVYEPGYTPMTCTKYGCKQRRGSVVVNSTSYAVVKARVLESETPEGAFCPLAVAGVNQLPAQVKNTMIQEIQAERLVKKPAPEVSTYSEALVPEGAK